ncbi:ATP synthase mitochondrial F1 complex assembly factor 1-like isoform X1 [Acanthaster planci]|uniref:ATP synthase mitochondrial F1 complex assembly factor 1-like isoform X1 n=1 Tax=Acanthaster planci TaxID=133434 RepID=A0A8B7ZKC7_ACAPL|nr:ATP synthase mitochondrial F1 complex assembly factor 1-like isoform X1 [Acanthaster planci]
MAAPTVRQILTQSARNSLVFSSYKNRFTTVQSPSKQHGKEELEKNKYFDKYAEKIKKAQSSNPDKFQSKLQDMMEIKKEKKWRDELEPPRPTKSKNKVHVPKLLKTTQSPSSTHGLDSIMKIDMIQDLPREEIEKIWTQYHMKKDCISAAIPGTTYEKIYQTAQENPLFLYPLPRKAGYEFYFAQFDNSDSFYFTSLINYQAYQENSPILLSMKHFTELQKEKGIVLMRGEMDTDLLSVQDAQFLANQLQLYYATDNSDRLKLLRTFNHHQDEFKHMDVITMLERSTFELPSATPNKKDL